MNLTLIAYSVNNALYVIKFKYGRLPPLLNKSFDFAARSQFMVVVSILPITRLLVSPFLEPNLHLSNNRVRFVDEAYSGSVDYDLFPTWLRTEDCGASSSIPST